jgi:hypothetical protein
MKDAQIKPDGKSYLLWGTCVTADYGFSNLLPFATATSSKMIDSANPRKYSELARILAAELKMSERFNEAVNTSLPLFICIARSCRAFQLWP